LLEGTVREIMRERRDIDQEYVQGKAVGRRPPAHDHVIIPIRNEELVDSFRYEMVIEVDHYVHSSPSVAPTFCPGDDREAVSDLSLSRGSSHRERARFSSPSMSESVRRICSFLAMPVSIQVSFLFIWYAEACSPQRCPGGSKPRHPGGSSIYRFFPTSSITYLSHPSVVSRDLLREGLIMDVWLPRIRRPQPHDS